MMKRSLILIFAVLAVVIAAIAALSREPQSRFDLTLDEPLTPDLALEISERTLIQHGHTPIEPVPADDPDAAFIFVSDSPERGAVRWRVEASEGPTQYRVTLQRVGKLVTAWPEPITP